MAVVRGCSASSWQPRERQRWVLVRRPGLAEVGGLGLHCGAGTFRVAAENQERGEAHRQLVGKANTIETEVEFVEFASRRKGF